MSIAKQGWRFAVADVGSTLIHIAVAASLIQGFHYRGRRRKRHRVFHGNRVFLFLDSVWTFRWKLPVGSLRPFVVVAFMGLSATVAMTTAIQNAGYPYQVGIMAVVAFVPWRSFSLQKI